MGVLACEDFPRAALAVAWKEDFLDDNGIANFTVTQNDGTGTGSGAASATNDGHPGIHTLTTNSLSGADGEWHQIQGNVEWVKLGLGRTVRFVCRCKIDDAHQSYWFAGLCITDTGIIGIASGPTNNFATDFIGFYKTDGSTTVQFANGKNQTDWTNTNGVASIATMTTGWNEWAFEVVMDTLTAGKGTIRAWLNGQPLILGTSVEPLVSTAICEDEDLTPTVAIANGNTSQRTLDIDCIEVRVTREASS